MEVAFHVLGVEPFQILDMGTICSIKRCFLDIQSIDAFDALLIPAIRESTVTRQTKKLCFVGVLESYSTCPNRPRSII